MYLLSQEFNSYGLLSFDEDNEVGPESISKGYRIGELSKPLRYKVKKKKLLRDNSRLHFIESAWGPLLVGPRLQEVFEKTAFDRVEFLPATIDDGSQKRNDYSVINILDSIPCVDMEKSEYDQTNFDPVNPHYMFRYTVLRQGPEEYAVALSAEQENQIVVSDAVRAECTKQRMKGLIFYTALDLTYGGRTIATKI